MGEKEDIIERAIEKGNQVFCKLNESRKWLSNWSEEKAFFKEYYSIIANEVNIEDEFLSKKLFFKTHYADHCTIYPEVVEVLKDLTGKYKLAVISNAFPSLDWIFDKLDIRKYFYSITLSATVGVAKPDRKIYEFALEQATAKAEESLFIDNQIENVKGAIEVGMQAIHIDRNNNEDLNIIKEILL